MKKLQMKMRKLLPILFFGFLFFAQNAVWGQESINIVIDRLPENTPHDATLYLVGSFNHWNPADPEYRFTKVDDQYKIVLSKAPKSMEYKITRGNWSSVEGRENGRAMQNRIYEKTDNQANTIHITIRTWEDLAGERISLYILILLLAALQGFILLAALQGLQDNNRSANHVFSLVIFFTSLALLGRVGVQYRGLFQEYPKMILIPDYLLFLYSPLFFFYVQKLLTVQSKTYLQRWYHFIPAFLQFLLYLPLLLTEKQDFIDNIVDRSYFPVFAATGFAALCYNVFYWYKCYHVVQKFREEAPNFHSFTQNTTFLYSVLILQGVCLVIWFGVFVLGAVDYILPLNLLPTVEFSVDSVWVLLSVITYFLGYVAMQQPEIFKTYYPENPILVANEIARKTEENLVENTESQLLEKINLADTAEAKSPEPSEKRYKDSHIPKEQLESIRQKLPLLMEKKKPFYNPKLTLSELAQLSESTPHALSRVINEYYEKNFQDFVNDYRIAEFKILALRKNKQHYTLLAIALEVGFNSKTAFNRAFKKATNLTPSEYVKMQGRENDGSV